MIIVHYTVMTDYYEGWGRKTDYYEGWGKSPDEIKAELLERVEEHGKPKDPVEDKPDKTLDEEIADAFISVKEVLINHKKESITQLQAIINERLSDGEDEYFLSHFREKIADLTAENDVLIAACREVKENPTQATVEKVKARLR